jgi:serine phosphatase RsbU (regulator of sigma subunit)
MVDVRFAHMTGSIADIKDAPSRVAYVDQLRVTHRDETLSFAACLIPSGSRGEPVAGDFFDVFVRDDAVLVVVIGDVAGHGFGAAARMTTLRMETRAMCDRAMSPAQVIALLDLAQSEVHPDEIATLWLGFFDERTGLLRYASAGHPPPVLAAPAGPTQLLAEASAPPLGTGVVGRHAVVDEVHVPVGALLVAYSDGLVERPDRDLDDQIEELRVVVERACGEASADTTLDQLVVGILADLVPEPENARDDVCLLVLRRELAVSWG